MALNPNKFIASYKNTDIAIVFLDSNGIIIKSINVCRYLSNNTEENILWVLLEGNKTLTFEFDTDEDAIIGSNFLQEAVNTLSNNCQIGGSGGGGSEPIPEPVVKTLTQYKTLASSGELIPLQWYDVTDTLNSLGQGLGQVFRILALTPDDLYPQGIVLGVVKNNEKIIFDLNSNKVSFSINVQETTIKTLNSTVASVNSSKIFAIASQGHVENCQDLFLDNSNVNLLNSLHIRTFNSNISLENSTNCVFENISGDFSSLNLNNIFVNNSTSLGKQGKETLALSSNNVSLTAYENKIVQILEGTLTSHVIITLVNPIAAANASFIVNISPTLVFSNKTISIKDNLSSEVLLIIKEGDNGKTFDFKYEAGSFYTLGLLDNSIIKTSLTVDVDNKTIFSNVLNFTPSSLENSQLYVNGIKYVYGNSEDYHIDNKDLIWSNKKFKLETTDKVEIYYW